MLSPLDFKLLPNSQFFDVRPMYIGLRTDIQDKLKSFPNTLNRVRSSVMFAELASKQLENWTAEAFFRASLAEYCAIEEMLKLDNLKGTNFSIKLSKNPLLHLLSLMRHQNIHVKSIVTSRQEVSAKYGNQDTILNELVISNLDFNELKSLRNGQYYSTQDLCDIVNWFNSYQNHWGAGYLIHVGIEILAVEICDYYKI